MPGQRLPRYQFVDRQPVVVGIKQPYNDGIDQQLVLQVTTIVFFFPRPYQDHSNNSPPALGSSGGDLFGIVISDLT